MRRFMAMALVLSACWPRWEQEYDERWAEMADHEDDALAAVRALAAGDLDATHAAARGLARTDEVPRLPEEVVPMLATVRARGQVLSETKEREAAATHLIMLAAECRACHAAMEVKTVGREAEGSAERAWLGLLWQDEATFAASGLEGEGWAARAEALQGLLAGTATEEGTAPEKGAAPEEPPTPEAPTPR